MSDSISRLDVLEEINRIGAKAFTDYADYSNFFDFVSELPKSEERPTGEWVEDNYAGIHCSECDYTPSKDVVIKLYADGSRERRGNYNLTPYCPICGAYMKGKEKKNE